MIFYVYSKIDGIYLYRDSGHVEGILMDIPDNCDFTLKPPPDYNHTWRWIDSKWTTDQPS